MTASISTRELEAFLALADSRHFTRAAERCHLSQSAFSQLIRRLEASAGVRLFERSTRNVALTPEGEVFAEAVRPIKGDIDAALAGLRDHAARRKGRVAIAALPSLTADVIPQVIAAYRKQYPGVGIELFDALSDRCLALVRDGRVDFALTAAGPNFSEFDTIPVYTDRFYLACRRDHPLAKKKSVRLSDLAGCELIHLARSSSVRQHLDPVLRKVPHASGELEVEQLATLAGLIANGLGVSLIPELTLFHFKRDELTAIPVDAPTLVRPILMAKRKGRSLSAAAQGMLELIRAALPVRRGSGGGPPRRKIQA